MSSSMKRIESDQASSAPRVPFSVMGPSGLRLRFISLRTKFILFFALNLILTCSTLSWYFVEGRRALLTDHLHQVGTILLTSVVNNGQFRYGALIAEDRATLEHFVESLMAIDDVVYVVIHGTDGLILAQHNKLAPVSSGPLTFTQERRFYPDERLAEDLYRAPVTSPKITPVMISQDKVLMPGIAASSWFRPSILFSERLYDLAMPVVRRPAQDQSLSSLTLEQEEGAQAGPRESRTTVQGVVQIGMSDAQAKQELVLMIRDALVLTALIIAAGILGAQILTLRVTTPLRSLASVARQLAEGDIPAPLTPQTNDEVGQLTNLFNMMTRSLQERNVAIQSNVNVIQRQISQLSDVHQLLDTILQLLMNNLGFSRMLLMLRQDDRNTAYVAQIAGVSPEVAAAACQLNIPVQEGDTFIADLLIHGKPVHIHDLESQAHRMHPQMLALARQVKVSSFVAAPLQRHSRILGLLVGDRESFPCTSEDLSILVTIASHVSSAIDNARAYGRLTELTQHLEQRIEARTRELSIANERLQDHDRRRSMFVSVASHELRTPMTAIRSFADNMLDGVAGPLTERQTAYLTRIGHNLNRLTRIINQLLDWSRLDLQKEVLHVEPVCLKQTATLVVESLRPVADEKKIALELRQSQEIPPVCGDRDKLEQVLWNLIGNAIKFTPPKGVITVSVEVTEGDMIRVCINDTGCGIAPEHLTKIFDEFSKVPSTMPTSQGARLGLFITKSLIIMHGGRIWVESKPATGTQVSFLLPCTQSPEREEA